MSSGDRRPSRSFTEDPIARAKVSYGVATKVRQIFKFHVKLHTFQNKLDTNLDKLDAFEIKLNVFQITPNLFHIKTKKDAETER